LRPSGNAMDEQKFPDGIPYNHGRG
jgi:hypothetical protein